MTTEGLRGLGAVLVLAGLVASVALSCATTVSNRTGDSLDTTQYPPDIRDAYKVFAVRCSRCHTLARPLNARIRDPQQWVRYVARMRLNPASGINAKNGEIILRFLLYYMHQRAKERGGRDADSELEPEQSQLPELSRPPAEEAPPEAADPAADESAFEHGLDGSKLVSTGDSHDSYGTKMFLTQRSGAEAYR
jgi:hypothetical protein